MSVTETVYLNRDNTVDLLLKADGVAQDLSSVTRMILKEENGVWSIDSQTYGSAFNWNPGTTGKVILDLAAALADQSVTTGSNVVRLVVYDPSNTDGIVWDTFVLIVK